MLNLMDQDLIRIFAESEQLSFSKVRNVEINDHYQSYRQFELRRQSGRRCLPLDYHWMPSQIPVKVGRGNWWKPAKLTAQFALSSIPKLKYDVYRRQGSRVSCLAQTGFAVFGKGVQLLISGSPYAETE